MNWRSLFGDIKTCPQYSQNPQKGYQRGGFEDFEDFEHVKRLDSESFEKAIDAAIKTLDVAEIRMSKATEDVRRKTFELELVMTRQANDGDFESAKKTLDSWLMCWLNGKSG